MNYFDKALSILEKIESKGFKAYIVGGAVRDYLLKIDLNDIDITTNMPLDDIKANFKTMDNGLDYDSITIIDEYDFEITHFRRDISYENHRHPIVEETNDILDDLRRRDFTMNALIMDKDELIFDNYNGIDDIKNKIIRAIGDPYVRFDEDALRILRALHFSSKLDFKIEENTLKALIDKRNLLASLSDERLNDYFYKIVYSKNPNGLNYINEHNIFEFIPKYQKLLALVNDFDYDDLKLAYYFKYNEYFSDEKDLKKKIDTISYLIENDFDNYSLYKTGNELLKYVNLLKSLGYDTIDIVNRFNYLALKNEPLALSNKEFSELYEGKEIGEKIELVLKAVLEKKIKNTREDILKFLNR